MRKFDWLRPKGQWGAKSPHNEKTVAMATQINALKGHLKVEKKVGDGDALKYKKTTGDNVKKKNKKNNGDKTEQKDNKQVWKKVPPKDSN